MPGSRKAALTAVLFMLSWPAVALAQTGSTKDIDAAVDVNTTMNGFGFVLIPLFALIVLALFEPWTWPRKLAERNKMKKKRDKK